MRHCSTSSAACFSQWQSAARASETAPGHNGALLQCAGATSLFMSSSAAASMSSSAAASMSSSAAASDAFEGDGDGCDGGVEDDECALPAARRMQVCIRCPFASCPAILATGHEAMDHFFSGPHNLPRQPCDGARPFVAAADFRTLPEAEAFLHATCKTAGAALKIRNTSHNLRPSLA